MNQIVRLNHERDFDILFFLWKWKLAPSIVIFHRFFEHSHFTTAYNRLRQLEQAGLIRSISIDKNHGRLWTLEDLGFRSIKHLLPDLVEEGYKSENLVHDLLVNSVHCGDWYKTSPEGYALFSEQELRRFPLREYPQWIPQSDMHRPDGYWHLPLGKCSETIALEVELNYKDDVRYGSLARFYESAESVSAILWVAKTQAMAEKILRAIKDGINGTNIRHSFIILSDFLNQGWQAKVIFGQRPGDSMNEILRAPAKHLPKHTPSTCLEHAWLDTRKRPVKTKISKQFNIYHF